MIPCSAAAAGLVSGQTRAASARLRAMAIFGAGVMIGVFYVVVVRVCSQSVVVLQ